MNFKRLTDVFYANFTAEIKLSLFQYCVLVFALLHFYFAGKSPAKRVNFVSLAVLNAIPECFINRILHLYVIRILHQNVTELP